MASIYISDIASTELQELDLLADSENGLKDLSNNELNNVQGGIAPFAPEFQSNPIGNPWWFPWR